MKYADVRKAYLDHMKEYNHAIIGSAPIVPEDNPTLLFVNSGMFPLIPYLMGEDHPEGTRLANSQRCIRTVDIDDVGDSTHLTAFEMLGNWSLNDYFKETAIPMSMEFFVEKLGFPIEKIYVSVFEGDENTPADKESIKYWKEEFEKRGIDANFGKGERIQPFDKSENWWEVGDGGPCGPCTEIFYDTGVEKCSDDCSVACECGKYVEIGNNVLMEYRKEDGEYSDLGRHNIDFGGGLIRLTMLLQDVDNAYDTDIFSPTMKKITELRDSDEINDEIIESMRIIADHINAATWMITDGVKPSNSEQGYILRRLIRRAIRKARSIDISQDFVQIIAESTIESFSESFGDSWGILSEQKEETLNILADEEEKFSKALENGLKEVEKVIEDFQKEIFVNKDGISFSIYETHGFPPEMLIEELESAEIEVNVEKFWAEHEAAFKKHQETSRSSSKGRFKGGLSDTSDATTKLHTATHLLLAALYEIVGDHIFQKGSNITPERLRLDFPGDDKLSEEVLQEVEDLVNSQIEAGLPISFEEMDTKKALEIVPYAAFEDRYDDVVKVYTMGEGADAFSIEICRGPHVENTSELGTFKITKHESVGSGVKRIKAVLE